MKKVGLIIGCITVSLMLVVGRTSEMAKLPNDYTEYKLNKLNDLEEAFLKVDFSMNFKEYEEYIAGEKFEIIHTGTGYAGGEGLKVIHPKVKEATITLNFDNEGALIAANYSYHDEWKRNSENKDVYDLAMIKSLEDTTEVSFYTSYITPEESVAKEFETSEEQMKYFKYNKVLNRDKHI